METVRQLPATVRDTFRGANQDPLSWGELLALTMAGVGLILIGALLAFTYCDYRRTRDFELTRQVVDLGSRCVTTLGEVVPGAFVLAQQRPRLITHGVSDSAARDRRWMTPLPETHP